MGKIENIAFFLADKILPEDRAFQSYKERAASRARTHLMDIGAYQVLRDNGKLMHVAGVGASTVYEKLYNDGSVVLEQSWRADISDTGGGELSIKVIGDTDHNVNVLFSDGNGFRDVMDIYQEELDTHKLNYVFEKVPDLDIRDKVSLATNFAKPLEL